MNPMLTHVEAVMPAVLSASISAAAMVLVVQAIVWMANARLSPRWCHALWLVVFVRLALPVLPEVPPSITPPKPTAHAVAEYISTLEATPLELHTPMAQRPALEFQSMPEPPVAARMAPPPTDAPPVPWRWKQIFAVIWIAVAAGMLGVIWISSWWTVRRWHRLSGPAPSKVTQVFEDLCAELQIRKQPKVMLCPALATPVLAGLWRPRILLPVQVAEAFSVEQLRHVLAHELGHLQRRDLWLHAAVAVLQSLHWFNPFAWYAARRVRAAAERCCDEWVLQRLSLKQGRDYADTLLRVLENPGRSWPLPGIAAMAESKADLTHRIRALAKWGALPKRWMSASACILGVLSFLALTVPGVEERNSSNGKASPLPTAEITVTVLDGKKEPLAGATVKMSGLRVVESPRSGYGWPKREGIPLSFTTGKDGGAAIKYPKVLEGGEHVDRISFHVFANGQESRFTEVLVNADPAPIQLEQAATLRVRALLPDDGKVVSHFLVQQGNRIDLNRWQNELDGSQVCGELAPGVVRLRAVWHDTTTGQTWFSKLHTTTLKRGEEKQLDLKLLPAQVLKGTLDATIPRPVRNGSIHAQFIPASMGQEYGLLWQSTTRVAEDGSFVIPDCPPEGDAYVAAVCEGYFSTSPEEQPIGQQIATKVEAGSLSEKLTLVMRPTATLAVSVKLPKGSAAEGIKMVVCPNTHFGMMSTVYGYTGEWVGRKMASVSCEEQRQLVEDPWSEDMFANFTQPTNAKGEVLFKNLPESSLSLLATSDVWELPPAEVEGTGHWHRFKIVPLKAGEHATTTISLVKKGTTTIPKPPEVSRAPVNSGPPRQHRYVEQAAPTESPNPNIKAEQVEPDEFAGVVLDARGKPIAKAHVLSYGVDDEKWMQTDEQGRYRIFVEPDYYTVTIFGNALGTCEHGEVWVPKGEHKKMDFQGDPAVKLEADVVDAQTGEPVVDAELAILYFDMDKRWKGNGRGRVTVSGVFAGNCEFYPKHPGYARWWSEEAVNSWQRFEPENNKKTRWQRNFDDLTFKVTAETAGRPVKIFMERAVIVRGRVLDPDGKPVAGATVDPAHTGTGNSLTGDTRFSAKTDSEGRYELRLPASNAAQYNLVAHDGKYQEWRMWANGVLPPVRTKPGDVLENVDIHLTQPGIVKGVVLDKEGKPVAGQRVRTEPVDRNENRYYDPETVTDKEGKFSLPFVRPGKQYLWTSQWNHDPERVKPEDLHIIEVKAGETQEVKARKYED